MHQFVTGLDGGGLALDVGEDKQQFFGRPGEFGLEHGHAVVGFLQAQAFVEFEVLFDVEVALEILHADVVHVELVAGGDGADAIENVFRAQAPGTECTTTSASGSTSWTALVTASVICSERWKVTLRATPTEKMAK